MVIFLDSVDWTRKDVTDESGLKEASESKLNWQIQKSNQNNYFFKPIPVPMNCAINRFF